MIYTKLSLEDEAPVVRITYVHTGSGGGRDQEFTFTFATGDRPSCIKLEEGRQTADLYI